MDVNKHRNKKSPKNNMPSIESQITNETELVKIKNVHSTPNKVNNLQDCKDTIINENTNSPRKNVRLVIQQNLLKSPLFKSPAFKKCDKSVESATTQTNTCPQRRRTISSDYDTFKSELYSANNFNNFDTIELLHDLDSIVTFENSGDLFSTLNIDMQDDGLLEINKDPATDPLSISDSEKKNNDALINSDLDSSKRYRMELKPQIKERRSKRSKKHKLNSDEKSILKELEKSIKLEKIPLTDRKKLKTLHIKLIHKVPPQHEIELSGSHAPTKKEKILFQQYGPIRKGLYTPIEDKIIKKNWNKFCELHDWDTTKVEPFLYWRHNNKYYIHDVEERQKFVQFLANGLPWRTLYSVYSRFKVLYRNKITYARYTSAEDEKILTYIHNKHLAKRDTKYSELAKLLNRTGRSVFKRYQYLKRQIQDESETEVLDNVRWTLPLVKKFIETLLNVTLSENIRELKDATLPKPVWKKMEEKLNINENVLKTYWQHQLHMQLFSTEPIYLNDIKIQLIEYMYEKGISNTREIIWPNVAKHFDGMTAVFLCKVFYYLVQESTVKDINNFADIVEHLYHIKISEIQKTSTDKFLPRILYKNGKISLLDVKNNKTITTDVDSEATDQH
ncbi:uncharacterized protein LOC105837813 [Monomorium pharaonis]|uniref:uncharacterized protein LOC105837813 n=1 Tax=Monomorium pharaonis TaxID=307658 RepID=UPI0017461D34|nr:uncharacterized protein LOC105837813 [Monomorium pharaonis]